MGLTPEERFRQLAEMEAESPATAGRGVFFDLSSIPEAQRPAVVAELQEVIRKEATAGTPITSTQPQPT